MYGVNERFKGWLLDRLAEGEEGLRGIVPVDFYRGAGLVEVMVAFNLVQRRRGGERCC
jgi:hypothetical protein